MARDSGGVAEITWSAPPAIRMRPVALPGMAVAVCAPRARFIGLVTVKVWLSGS